jgi:ribosomal protein S15P/S13E
MSNPAACTHLTDAVECEDLSSLPPDDLAHLAECTDCQGFVADLNSIVAAARQIPAEVEPPARVWISLRNQLAAEGLIREHVVPSEPLAPKPWWYAHWSHAQGWHGFAGLLHGRVLATASVGLLILIAGAYQLRNTNVATTLPQPVAEQREVPDDTGPILTQQENEMRSAETASTLSTSPVDDSLQKDLHTLDAFIAECKLHLKANPRDQLTREYLDRAYQQKAELLAEMMDRGRSVN